MTVIVIAQVMLMTIDNVRLQLMTHKCAGVFAVCSGGQL